jgi:hypothetical protein
MGSSYSDDFFKGIQGAVGGLLTGDFPGAMAKMNALVEAFPEKFASHFGLGFLFFAGGETEKAMKCIESANKFVSDEDRPFVHDADYIANGLKADSSCQQVGDDIWVVESFYFPFGGLYQSEQNMIVVCLEDGGLALVNPVELNDTIREGLQKLGSVRYLITPTEKHHKFIGAYQEAYPEAKLYGPQSHQGKEDVSQLKYEGFLNDKEPFLPEAFEQVTTQGHNMNETFLIHKKSKSLIVSDMTINCRELSVPFFRFWCWLWGGAGKFGPLGYHFVMVQDKEAVRKAFEQVVEKDFAQIVPVHGKVLKDNPKENFKKPWDALLQALP